MTVLNVPYSLDCDPSPKASSHFLQQILKPRDPKIRHTGLCVWRLGLGVSVSEFWVSDLVLWISGLVLRVSGFGFRVSCLRFRLSCFGSRVSGLEFRVSGMVSGIGFRASCLMSDVSCRRLRVSGLLSDFVRILGRQHPVVAVYSSSTPCTVGEVLQIRRFCTNKAEYNSSRFRAKREQLKSL